MKILITGAAGFIGQKLAKGLWRAGNQIVALDDLSTGSIENLLAIPKIEFVQGCVTCKASVARAAKDVDLIIHLAGVVGQLRVQTSPSASNLTFESL